ncbi:MULTISPECIES: nucleotidyltransferase domain-containing protein [unclassified Nocardiopsis]|uniref:nucleotidyltransferase domain-containing protein n=1 Tax=unclassified Nocardiopsis TaxID=2649073 RepID=UPI00135B8C53|nr:MULTISPECIES: nucleotidyltransferase domain-containing protein [unclassified Nocardiopsis]
MSSSDDARFLSATADRLASLPGVEAVALGGSRAQGAHRPDSDWDLAVYYRGNFDPQDLRDLGWPGEVSEIGGWGGGVFNGGAWLRIDGRAVDVHYRDLDSVEHELAEAERGRFRVEPLMFHLAGIPSYLVVAELALGRVLVGDLPRPDYPRALRESAPPVWRGIAAGTLSYAEHNHAPHGRVAQTAGLVAQAASQAAHAVLAQRGVWVTNDKTLLSRAGLEEVDLVVAGMTADPQDLTAAVAEAGRILARA